jgi:hypothetical protein
MSAAYTGITIEQRACYDLTLTIQRNNGIYNLSGVTLTGQIRRDFDDALQAVLTTQIISIPSGIAKISLNATQTLSLDLAPCYWDLYADKSGECPDKLMYGPVYVIKSATNP